MRATPVKPGEMCRAYVLQCAHCGRTLLLPWDSRQISESQARQQGWSRTIKAGWVCPCRLEHRPEQLALPATEPGQLARPDNHLEAAYEARTKSEA